MGQEQVYLWLGSEPGRPMRWWREGEPRMRESADTAELARQCAGREAVLLAPALSMLTLTASMPAMPAQRLAQALPYALEEQIAGDVESMHFAHAARDADGHVAVVALNTSLMTEWLELCEQAQLRPMAIYSDVLCLPWKEGEWTLLLEAHGALLRTARHSGYAIDPAQWPQLLALAWEGQGEERAQAVRLLDARGDDAAPLPELPSIPLKVEACAAAKPLLCRAGESKPINLMQGPFSRREQVSRIWAPWRASALLLAAVVGVLVAHAAYDYVRLSRLDESLYTQTRQLFRQTFPEVKNIANPRIQMERKLAALRGAGQASPFSRLFGWAGEALAGERSVTLQGVRYRDGRLELALELVSLPQLDTLKAALEKHQVAVEVRNASARGDKVEANIMLEEAGR